MAQRIEKVEDRTLLTSQILLLGTELTINTDGNEDVIVRDNPVITGFVEVLINNVADGGLPVVASAFITSLVVQTGDTDNRVDLSGINATNFPNLVSITINTGNGDDTIIGSDLADSIDAGDGDDSIIGNLGDDTLNANDGNDTVFGGAGNDEIDGEDGDDSLVGGDGNDTITAGDGADIVTGDLGNDSITGGNGPDNITGGDGDDNIIGDVGDDTIMAGLGNDVLLGGGGMDFIDGEDGDDLIIGNGGRDTLLGGLGDDDIFGGGSGDSIDGGDGDDSLSGDLGNDTIRGNDGNDTILGGGGDDLAFGDSDDSNSSESGDDSIFGNAGDDTVIGVTGSDLVVGGSGNDLVRSALDILTETPVPPAPPIPPIPPPSPGASVFDDATDSGAGVNVGTSAMLQNGIGDGFLTIPALDGVGDFTNALYDPIGPIAQADTTFSSRLYFRSGLTGVRPLFSAAATNVSNIRATATEANSTFDINNLAFALTQTLEDTFDAMGVRNGTLLTQTYRVTNTGAVAENFEIVRYMDADLFFDGTLVDGGGRLIVATGEELLFETDAGGGGATATTFLGITGLNGTIPTTNRFEIEDFSNFGAILAAGTALDDMIVGDGDLDGFIDPGSEYDVTLGLRNTFSIPVGGSDLYTTHTIFGSGAPNDVGANAPPVANDDSGGFVSAGGTTLTLDVVSNDTDDRALDFSTVTITTQPANGIAVSLGNGLVEYTPNIGFSGVDTFQYTIADDLGSVSAPATVTITVIAPDPANDTLFGGSGRDTLIGLDGNDLIVGDMGDDLINGGGGDDILYGGANNDTLFGDAGDDTIAGQGGRDLMIGGDGEDVFTWRGPNDGRDTVSGGNQADTAQVNSSNSGNTLTVTQSTDDFLVITEGTGSLTIEQDVSHVEINAASGDDIITIGDLNNIVRTSLTINGETGNDTIDASNGVMNSLVIELNGGIGDDVIIGSASAETLLGGDGSDNLTGGGGNDLVDGQDGDDVLRGGEGNDTVNGGDGNDNLFGDDGNDLLDGGFGDDFVDGGNDDDTLLGGFGNDALIGSFGNDSLNGGIGRDFLAGGTGDDTLDGGRNNDTLRGHAGNDKLIGNHGDDSISGDGGDDEIVGGDGNDTLFGGNGNDGLAGNDGDDFIQGDAGEDTIVGGDGNDNLVGGANRDILLGGDGADTLNGNGGNDIGAFNEGADFMPPNSVETIDENFVLSLKMLESLDGI
jgi:Ca2+-binding RTX toxin-like protein